MKKTALLLILLVGSFVLRSQESPIKDDNPEKNAVNTGTINRSAYVGSESFTKVDELALGLSQRYKTIPALAKDLVSPFSSQEEKVRAIFMWMTNNIAYDCVAYHSSKSTLVSFRYKTPEELAEKKEKYYYEYATRTLISRKAVCEGYAALFNALCNSNGIETEIVIGTASNNIEKIKRLKDKKNFYTNHTWNKVKIDGIWYYLDATWASGYCDVGVKHFFKEFNAYYYITPLDNLYETHIVNQKLTDQRNQKY